MFEIPVDEALDRVSRDQADVATLYKHLRFAGVTVVTLAEARSASSTSGSMAR